MLIQSVQYILRSRGYPNVGYHGDAIICRRALLEPTAPYSTLSNWGGVAHSRNRPISITFTSRSGLRHLPAHPDIPVMSPTWQIAQGPLSNWRRHEASSRRPFLPWCAQARRDTALREAFDQTMPHFDILESIADSLAWLSLPSSAALASMSGNISHCYQSFFRALFSFNNVHTQHAATCTAILLARPAFCRFSIQAVLSSIPFRNRKENGTFDGFTDSLFAQPKRHKGKSSSV